MVTVLLDFCNFSKFLTFEAKLEDLCDCLSYLTLKLKNVLTQAFNHIFPCCFPVLEWVAHNVCPESKGGFSCYVCVPVHASRANL